MLSFSLLGQLLFYAEEAMWPAPGPSGLPMKNAVIVITMLQTEESSAVLQCCRSQGAESGGRSARCLISNYALGWKYTNKSVAATLPVYFNC